MLARLASGSPCGTARIRSSWPISTRVRAAGSVGPSMKAMSSWASAAALASTGAASWLSRHRAHRRSAGRPARLGARVRRASRLDRRGADHRHSRHRTIRLLPPRRPAPGGQRAARGAARAAGPLRHPLPRQSRLAARPRGRAAPGNDKPVNSLARHLPGLFAPSSGPAARTVCPTWRKPRSVPGSGTGTPLAVPVPSCPAEVLTLAGYLPGPA